MLAGWHSRGAGGIGGAAPGGGLSLSSFAYSGKSVAVASHTHVGISVSSNGLHLYLTGWFNNFYGRISRYGVATAWDISTAVSVNGINTSKYPYGGYISNSGEWLYFTDYATNNIRGINLGTAYDITSVVAGPSFSSAAQGTTPLNVKVSLDGYKMYVYLHASTTVYQYSLGTAFDPSTATYDGVSLSIGLAFDFSANGSQLIHAVGTDVFLKNLSTAWDISTASSDVDSLSLSGQMTGIRSVSISDEDSKIYALGTTNRVYQYETA
jgi:hypothetical protein